MVRILLGVVFALVVAVSQTHSGEPTGEAPMLRQALIPDSMLFPPGGQAPSPYPTTGAPCIQVQPAQVNLSAEQLEGMNRAIELLETSGHREAALELRHKVTELRLDQTLRQLEAMTEAHGQLQKEIDNLRPAKDSPQVMLSFHVLEVSRTKLRDLGFDMKGPFELLQPTKKGEAFLVREADAEAIDGLIDALKSNHLAKTLAEPTLVTVVGRVADFHSGGEVPVMIPQRDSSVSCEFRPFGTEIQATPRLTEDGDLQLELRIRVSELDQSLEVPLNGQKIPGFRTRQISTGVEIKPGHGVVLGGLRQTRVESLRGEGGEINEIQNEIETLFIVKPKLEPAADK